MSDNPLQAAGNLVPEEQDLARALIEIAETYGKFNEDKTGIWADYHEPEDNPYAEMGVKCGNCVLYRGGEECAIIAFKVDSEGYCRFAVLPDGSVDPSKAPAGTKPFEQHEMLVATAGSKKAPKKDRISGSDKNSKGSASGGRKIVFSKAVEESLREKVRNHNENIKADGKKASLSALKAAYRRGAGAFSSSHRPDQNRNSWAMARVNAYLHLLKTGSPKNKNYVQDNDLLPAGHPRSSRGVTAAAFELALDEYLTVELRDENEYAGPEHAVFSLAEYSGLGYEMIPVLRAAWLRATQEDEPAFERAKDLAVNLYESRDADLLPRNGKAN
jgi:hypothetical protein